MSTTNPFHLGWFVNGTSVQGWGQPFSGNIGTQWQSADIFKDLARAMERSCFDYMLLEDNTFIGDAYGNSMEAYLKHAFQGPRQDPFIVATVLGQVTSRLGIIPTAGTFAYHPYLLARMVGSLDQLTEGRMGVNIVTGTSDRALQNYGFDGMEEHDHRYEMADDFLSAAKALWDTWEPDAVVADTAGRTFADHTKVRRADYRGPFYASRGPLNSGPLPQGQPVISQAGGSPRGIEFAAKQADTIVAIQKTPEKARIYRDKVRAAAAAQGRNPDDIKVMFAVWPIIAGGEAEARERKEAMEREVLEHIDIPLAKLSKSTDIDFSRVPRDVPLGKLDLSTNGTQSFTDYCARNADATLEQTVLKEALGNGPAMLGTVDAVASQIEEFVQESGGDGILIGTMGLTRRIIAEITDGLVPELQRRGVTRTEYEHSTLRENLLAF